MLGLVLSAVAAVYVLKKIQDWSSPTPTAQDFHYYGSTGTQQQAGSYPTHSTRVNFGVGVVEDDVPTTQLRKKELVLEKEQIIEVKWIKHYCSSHRILLVGEGDFSFSASLAMAFGSATNMVATSLDPLGFLKENYMKAISNIGELKSRGCIVLHRIDATKMADNSLKGMIFDRIVYNFPHAGFTNRDKPREDQIREHQTLISLFMKNAKKMIKKDGEIHISHKSYGFFLEWKIESLGSQNGLRVIEKSQFDLSDYPGYNTKFGYGGDKNFECHPSKTYKFGF
ncbi:hypothetical protein GIB67_001089 [Kingdonia uniflora]|uniref:25S rRNA (uridine-N(3))-methyltransferase BMT5-like domain-containing protein n=1 Tax=Kingdonia uniflora TaxID=39325 RepID=A0A7J7MG44_9MAGN|nr:hypothetical protein GIB67_001089 [Kingdonia uniflora]